MKESKLRKIKDFIVKYPCEISITVVFLCILFVFFIPNIVRFSREKECVVTVAETFQITDYYFYTKKVKREDFDTSKYKRVYIVEVYNEVWYIEAIVSVNKKGEVKIEKLLEAK